MAYGGAYGLDLSFGGGIPADLVALFDQTKSLAARPRTITELPGGLTNRNYKVSTPDGTFVARMSSGGSELLADVLSVAVPPARSFFKRRVTLIVPEHRQKLSSDWVTQSAVAPPLI